MSLVTDIRAQRTLFVREFLREPNVLMVSPDVHRSLVDEMKAPVRAFMGMRIMESREVETFTVGLTL